jgi:uncharacterized protein (DUF1015 family)
MAVIAPFNGLTYNYYARQDFQCLVAPPYDVITAEEQEAYYETDPYNVIRLILGKKKTGDSDWDNQYTRAADCFKRWESAGILMRADHPCIYLTSMSYDPGNGGARRTRWGIITLVGIEDEDSRVILPHERTFSAHRDDRLKLMRTCQAQFSQIFGLYEDPDNTVMGPCKKFTDFPADIEFGLADGTSHRMWILQGPRLFKMIADAMRDKTILIADGHHRYETARNYRNLMRARHGRRPAHRSYEFVMMYLSNMSDEGLTILPSHRLIKSAPQFELPSFLETVASRFSISEHPLPGKNLPDECTALKQRLEDEGGHNSVMAFYHHNADRAYVLSLKPGVRDNLGEDLHPSQKKLDVLVLSRFVLQQALGFSKEDLDNEEIFHYQSGMRAAVTAVRSGIHQMAFLLNPTKMSHVKEIAGNALIMPRKSTYFFPKVISGLVFNKIDPHEIVQVP